MAHPTTPPNSRIPRVFLTLANASAIYAQLGRLSEAWEAAVRAEAIFSNDMTLHFIKAQIATNEQQPEEAEQELGKALAIKQTDAGWYNLGLLYTRERRFPEAVEALRHSARLSPVMWVNARTHQHVSHGLSNRER